MSHQQKLREGTGPHSARRPWVTLLTAPTRSDVLLTAVFVALELLGVLLNVVAGTMHQDPLVLSLYYVAGLSLLAWRHVAPLPVFALLLTHQLLTAPVFAPGANIGGPDAPIPLAGMTLTVAAVASDKPVRVSIPAAVLAWAAPISTFGFDGPYEWGNAMFWGVLVGIGWFVGYFTGRNRRRIHRFQQEQEQAVHAIEQERRRIAAELHDIVSHAVMVMTLHAAGGSRIIAQDPDKAAAALQLIERVGSQTMDELRRLLDVLRMSGPTGVEDLQPLHSLEHIDELAASVRAAGMDVRVTRSGEPRPLDPSVAHTAYRVLQEALTNVTKHAGQDAHVNIQVYWSPEKLVLVVRDSGGSGYKSHSTAGYGLIGLRERTELVGGRFEYGTNELGFSVRAELPVGA
jgi:signal transduction histidine kinase